MKILERGWVDDGLLGVINKFIAWAIDELQDPSGERWGEGVQDQDAIDEIVARLRAGLEE